jgi:hypothetical protein
MPSTPATSQSETGEVIVAVNFFLLSR